MATKGRLPQAKGATTIDMIAKELEGDYNVNREVLRSQFEFLHSLIKEKKYAGVKFIKLGKFLCKPKRLEVLNLTKDEQTKEEIS